VNVGLDLTAPAFHNYQGVAFLGRDQANFETHQFGAGLLSNSLAVTGPDGTQQGIVVGMAADQTTSFSAASWIFTNWEAFDYVAILGSQLGDTIVGSSGTDVL
jgi:hypothetical protein